MPIASEGARWTHRSVHAGMRGGRAGDAELLSGANAPENGPRAVGPIVPYFAAVGHAPAVACVHD